MVKNLCGKYHVSDEDIYLFSALIFVPLQWHK